MQTMETYPGKVQRRFLLALWVCCLSVLIPVRFSQALEGDTALFPQQIKIGAADVQRQGVGRMRRWMITGVDVALYVPPATARDQILADVPRALSFYYYVSISGEQFSRAAEETLRQNILEEEWHAHAAEIEKMGTWFATVKRGDRYLLSYEPGRGTALALNGVEKGVIPGAGFAAIYFQIWLGVEPIDARLYRAMTAGMPSAARE